MRPPTGPFSKKETDKTRGRRQFNYRSADERAVDRLLDSLNLSRLHSETLQNRRGYDYEPFPRDV